MQNLYSRLRLFSKWHHADGALFVFWHVATRDGLEALTQSHESLAIFVRQSSPCRLRGIHVGEERSEGRRKSQ